MAKSMLPILALGAAALFLMKKKGGGGATEVPANVSFMPIGNVLDVATIVLGPDVTDSQANQAVSIVSKHAKKHPTLPFEILKGTAGPGINVTVATKGVPSAEWAENVSYLDPTLADMLAAHVIKSGTKENEEPEGPEETEEELPPNVTLGDVGDFQWGATVLLAPDVTDEQTVQVIDMVSMHAKNYPALPFEVKLGNQGDGAGSPVTVMADGLPYYEVGYTPEGIGLILSKLLNERIPKP